MTVRMELFKPEIHYATISEWWKAQRWPVIPLTHLPDIGFVSFVDDVPACAGWLYQTDSAFCLFEWIVANPKVRREPRALALSNLIERAKDAAKQMGFKSIFINAKSAPLISRLEKRGFTVNESGMVNLTHNIRGE